MELEGVPAPDYPHGGSFLSQIAWAWAAQHHSGGRFQGRPSSCFMGPRVFASQLLVVVIPWAQCWVPVVTRQVLRKCKLDGVYAEAAESLEAL